MTTTDLRRIAGPTALALLVVLAATSAHAAGAAAMPWESRLQTIADSITGPVARAVGIVAIAVTGLAIAFAEGGSMVRRGLSIIFGLSIAFTASTFAASFFGFTAGAGF